MDDRVRPTLLVFAVAALFFFSRLDLPLMESMEPRHAEIARQMVAQESLMTPVLNGQYFFDKPPLLFWPIIASYEVFGVHDWAARLVPAFCGLGTVMVSFFWIRRIAGPRPALLGSLILCLSARYVYLARILTFDTMLCLWVTASLACAHVGWTERRRSLWLLSAVFCAFGVMTKGPVAVILVAVPLLFLRPRLRDGLYYALVLLLVAAPWFIWMVLKHPGYAQFYFWEHHVVRYVTPFNHEEPFWFHLPGVFLGSLPWTLLLPGMIGYLWRSPHRTPALPFLSLSAAWGLLFFSLSGCKRAVYILPMLPPMAMALGCYLDAILPQSLKLARRATVLALAMGSGGCIAAAVSGLLSWPFAIGTATLFAGFLVVVFCRHEVNWPHCLSATFATLFVAFLFVMPNYHDRFALRDAVRQHLESDEPIYCYPRTWDSVGFYLGRDDVRIFSTEQRDTLLEAFKRHPRALLVTRTGRTADGLLRDLPEGLFFEETARKGFVLIGRIRQKSPSPAVTMETIAE